MKVRPCLLLRRASQWDWPSCSSLAWLRLRSGRMYDFLHTLSYFLVMSLSRERKEIPPNTFLRLSNYALQFKEDPRAAGVLLYLL